MKKIVGDEYLKRKHMSVEVGVVFQVLSQPLT